MRFKTFPVWDCELRRVWDLQGFGPEGATILIRALISSFKGVYEGFYKRSIRVL